MAMGSRRTWPTVPTAAAVISEPMVAPMYTPDVQLNAWYTNGMFVARRPPKMKALIGTPSGSSQAGSMVGHCAAGAVKRAFGCAALAPVSRPICGVHRLPCQSRHSAGGSSVIPSHQTPPSGVSAVLVKMVFFASMVMAFELVLLEVPGATPNNPASGLIARSRPLASGLIQAMSSPTVHTFQPANAGGGMSMEKLVFPHALGNAPATYVFSPCGSSTPRMSICSAIQPSSRAMFDAIRSAKHFLPSSAFPPYPEP